VTPAQKFKFYFPAWTAAVRANGWHMEHGRLTGSGITRWGEATDEPARGDAHPTTELAAVIGFARSLAAAAHRGLKVDDLRHGAHVLALGRDKSSAQLTNTELDRVVALFRLLAAPEDLAAIIAWDAYQRGEDPGALTRVEYFIRRCPEAYVRSVCHGRFGTRNWESLTIAQKKLLGMTLANRKPARGGASVPASRGSSVASPHREPVAAGNDDPDWNV
jgi:hypothetical protein